MERIFNYTVGSPRLAEQLGFNALACIIDNPTRDWLFLPDANQWIPPLVVGKVLAFPGGTTTANAIFQAPAGIITASSTAGTQVVLRYTDNPLAPQDGTPIVEPAAAGNVPRIINFNRAVQLNLASITVPIPTGGQDGDIVVAFAGGDAIGAGSVAPTISGGTWASVAGLGQNGIGATGMAWAPWTGVLPSVTFTSGAVLHNWGGITLLIRGAQNTIPLAGTLQQNITPATTINAFGVQVVELESLVLLFAVFDDSVADNILNTIAPDAWIRYMWNSLFTGWKFCVVYQTVPYEFGVSPAAALTWGGPTAAPLYMAGGQMSLRPD